MTAIRLTATLRLNFHHAFTFYDAIPLISYFKNLGVSHVYSSPILTSTPGSMHGYDTVNCHKIDPARGGIDGLRCLVRRLREEGMGLILDIVPNHVGASFYNNWWRDVLRFGQDSVYARHFDIDWLPAWSSLRPKLLLPSLSKPLAEIITSGELTISVDAGTDSVSLVYGSQRFPLSPESEMTLLADAGLPSTQRLNTAFLASEPGKAFIHRIDRLLDPKFELGRARLLSLLSVQHYRLAWWGVASDLINWRRFFDVTSFVALRMDQRKVFEDAHKCIFDLYRSGLIDGLRIDHIDGLARPAEYCSRLRARLDSLRPERPEGLRDQAPIFVEKILAQNETLPLEWPVTGTTGYDFLEQVSLLLHHPLGEAPITALYSELGSADFAEIERAARHEKIDTAFRGAFDTLVVLLMREFPQENDLTQQSLGAVLRTLLTVFPVYRSYFADGGDSGADFRAINQAHQAARQRLPVVQHEILDRLCQYLADARIDSMERQNILERFEHLTAPLNAKAGEDTALYRYPRLLSRNEVGSNPIRFAAPIPDFHTMNQERFAQHPQAMLTTATHDHKRGEDCRARLMVLSEPEALWPKTVKGWFEETSDFIDSTAQGTPPTPADAYFIFQTLISSWPLDESAFAQYPERLKSYLIKALREAGERTNWHQPNLMFEAACCAFAERCATGPFRKIVASYVERIGNAAALNSLSQTLLRLTCPGVPDLYQGREFWDFSLVDPDNRRLVDYASCERLIADERAFAESCVDWKTGQIKQTLIKTVLNKRRNNPDLFDSGRYIPHYATGPLAEHIVAFERRLPSCACLVIAPRLTLALTPGNDLTVSDPRWADTIIAAGGGWQSLWHDNITQDSNNLLLNYLDAKAPIDILFRNQ